MKTDTSRPEPQGSSMEHRGFVGPSESYDIFSAVQFNLLTFLGLREQHALLDIGCGSLRAGRLFIPYLKPGHYFGLEPQKWLIDVALNEEIGRDIIRIKSPAFSHDENFTLSVFDRKFDFLLAHSIFSHATQVQVKRCLAEASKVMHPHSILAATFVEGDEDYSGQVWTLWAKYSFHFIEEAARENGLFCRKISWPSPDFQQWVLFCLQGNEEGLPAVGGTGDAMLESCLRQEFEFCKERLSRLEHHPYVRLGIAMNRGAKWLRFACNRLVRACRSI